jgi:hypothetical protein
MGQQTSQFVTEEELFQKNLKNCVIIYLKINNTELKDDLCMCIFNSIYEMFFKRELKDDLCIFETIYDMLLSEYKYQIDYCRENIMKSDNDYYERQKLINKEITETSLIETAFVDNLREHFVMNCIIINEFKVKEEVIKKLLTEILETCPLIYKNKYDEYKFFELLIRIIKTMNYTCELKIKLINNEIIIFKL